MKRGKRRLALILLLVALVALLVVGALRWREQFRAAPADESLRAPGAAAATP